jgi:SAM-dependent MidA family methyltransferase
MCHFRHRAHDDPFFLPTQDITSHVDFSASLGQLLMPGSRCSAQHSGKLPHSWASLPSAPHFRRGYATYLPLAAAQRLLLAEMGELFKVIALGRGIDRSLSGFGRGDISRLL